MRMKKNIVALGILFLAVLLGIGMPSTVQAKKKTKTKTTKKISLSKAKITLSKKSYTYNGKKKKPTVTLKYKKKKITKKKNYTVTYTKNKSAGTAKVTVKAKKTSKLYKGKKTKTFKINKASRKLVADRAEYTAIEGDGAFNITAKPTKGVGTITYSCATTNVIKVSSAGVVTVVAPGTATVNISISASTNYKAASTTTKVTISKKPITVDSEASIRGFNYDAQITKMMSEKSYMAADSHKNCPIYKLTAYAWKVWSEYTLTGLAPTVENDLTNQYIQCNNLCPQGFCYAGDYLLTTAYCADSVHNSCIFIYNKTTGAYLRTLVLSLKTHVGGITYDGQNIWVCHAASKQLQKISYADLQRYAQGTKGMIGIETVTLKSIEGYPSAVTYNARDGFIWVAKNMTLPNYKAAYTSAYASSSLVDESELPHMWPYMYVEGKNGASDQLVPATTTSYTADTPSEGYLAVKVEDYKETEESEESTGALITEVDTSSVNKISSPTLTLVDKTKKLSTGDEEEEEDPELETEKYYKFEAGDVIVSIEDSPITSVSDLNSALENCEEKEYDSITIAIQREMSVSVSETGDVEENEDEENKRLVQIEGTLKLGNYKVAQRVASRLIPNRVQGLAFSEDGTKLLLSRSTGRNTEKTNYISEVAIYDWDEDATDLAQPLRSIVIPPMVEQIEVRDGKLFMIFESAATLYLEGTDGNGKSEAPIDKLVSMPLIY